MDAAHTVRPPTDTVSILRFYLQYYFTARHHMYIGFILFTLIINHLDACRCAHCANLKSFILKLYVVKLCNNFNDTFEIPVELYFYNDPDLMHT